MQGYDPMTEDELEALDEFLTDAPELANAMDISTLDGFLTAVVCSPKVTLPSGWMPWIWDLEKGRSKPDFENEERAQYVFELLMRFIHDIAVTLAESPESYRPLLLEDDGDEDDADGADGDGAEDAGPPPVIDEWCSGFVMGMALDTETWGPLAEADDPLLATIMLYGTEDGVEELEASPPTEAQRRAAAAGLAESVRAFYAKWPERRTEQIESGILPFLAPPEPVRNEAKVGRNDPCPCGSGKKYKRCHGAE